MCPCSRLSRSVKRGQHARHPPPASSRQQCTGQVWRREKGVRAGHGGLGFQSEVPSKKDGRRTYLFTLH